MAETSGEQERVVEDPQRSELENFEFPIGFCPREVLGSSNNERHPDKLNKRSWNIALEPLQALPINGFMLWMSGDKLSFFPIMLIVMNFMRHFKAIIGMRNTFDSLMGEYAYLQILVFFLGHCLGLCLLLYKCLSIGLLRFGANEWASYSLTQQPYTKVVFGKLSLIHI